MAENPISLDAKQNPVVVINRSPVAVERSDVVVPCQFGNAVLVDVICEGGYSGTVVIYGFNGRAWLVESDPAAVRAVTESTRYVVLNVSQVVTAGISAIAGSGDGGITVVITPFIAAASATVNVTGSTDVNVAKYGGSNVSAANGHYVRPGEGALFPVSVADGQDAALGATADAAVATDAAGTVSGKLRGLVKLLAAAIDLTRGWLRVQPQPCTWSASGTSTANAELTVTQSAAGAGTRNYLSGLAVSWSGGAMAAGAKVVVKDGEAVIFDAYLGRGTETQGSVAFVFPQPLRGSADTALSVVVDAAGAGVTTKASAFGATGP